MFAIELYRKYLYNSTRGISNKDKVKKLSFERQKILDIINDLPNLFFGDKSVRDRGDSTVYTYIKREIISEAANRGYELVIFESNFFLRSVLSEIDAISESMVA